MDSFWWGIEKSWKYANQLFWCRVKFQGFHQNILLMANGAEHIKMARRIKTITQIGMMCLVVGHII